MKRRLTKLVVFLLLGAIVNVTVAVGFFLFTSGGTAYGQPLHDASWILDHRGSLPSETEFASLFEEYQPGFGVDWRTYRIGGTGFAQYVQAGWPVRCLDGGWWLNDEGMREYNDVVRLDLRRYSWVTPYSSFVPIGIKWLGLGINTLFYAVILWMLTLGPFTARRMIRLKRGHCIKCGYDLRETTHMIICSECGHEVRAEAGT